MIGRILAPLPLLVVSLSLSLPGLARADAPGPRVTVEGVKAGKELAAAAVDSALAAQLPAVQKCYQDRLAQQPGLAGTAAVTFVVLAGGEVAEVKVTGLADEALAKCLEDAVKAVRPGKLPDGKKRATASARVVFAAPAAEPSTIGHGSGAGQGCAGCGGPRREPTGPQVRIGDATAGPGLAKEIIRRYIRQRLAQIRYCYEKRLVDKPELKGKLAVRFTIGADGAVSAAEVATRLDAEVDACVLKVIQAIVFAKPAGGGTIKVTYPFVFQPAP